LEHTSVMGHPYTQFLEHANELCVQLGVSCLGCTLNCCNLHPCSTAPASLLSLAASLTMLLLYPCDCCCSHAL